MDRKLPAEAESLSGPSFKRPRLDLEGGPGAFPDL